ncbi:MAG: 3-phosphoshikimate 1-carboxyvinyltransferase [Campylobacterales bacterium]
MISPSRPLKGSISTIAPDKSISHRCAIFSLLADDVCRIENYLKAEDTLNSLTIASKLGADVMWVDDGILEIRPPEKIAEPFDILDCGNSGTSMRLYTGLLAGSEGFFVLTGDQYLRRRPMKRIVAPLRTIGATIDGRVGGDLAPLAIRGQQLKSFDYTSPIASAQVKSALILAALQGAGESRFREPELSRDHTERMLLGMGADLEVGEEIIIRPMANRLSPLVMRVPADPSSAFFFAVAAAIIPESDLTLEGVLLNDTRIEAFRVLQRMGADITITPRETRYETIGDIRVRFASLQAIEVSEKISWLIDELPALSIAMACAQGRSVVRNAQELRVKESDRIATVVAGLRACGIEVEEFSDGYAITGGKLKKSVIDSHGDHRIAMSFAIAGLVCGMEILDTACIQTSFPNFEEILSQIAEPR